MPLGMLGKYERLDVLGHGASGIVYLAKDTLLGRLVALKEVAASDAAERERVLLEARVLDRLRHPNIVQVYGVDEIGGKVVIAMEYVRGHSLLELLRQTPQLFVPEAVNIAAQVCGGLAFAHAQRTVHRDVKPANILVDESGTVKLVDFGLAEVLGTHSLAGGAGTFAYMAPETFGGPNGAAGTSGRAADIWAAGVVLWEMLAGRRPFRVDNPKDPFAWKAALDAQDALSVATFRADVPPELDAILRRALSRDPAERFADAGAMAQALREVAPAPVAPNNGQAGVVLSPRSDSTVQQDVADPPTVPQTITLPGFADTPDIDAFLVQAPDCWELAKTNLTNGTLAAWLLHIGEEPLAEVAASLCSDTERTADERLRDFLYRAGLDTAGEAKRAYAAGQRLLKAGRAADAVMLLERAIRLDPAPAAHHVALAEALRVPVVLHEESSTTSYNPGAQQVLPPRSGNTMQRDVALSTESVNFGTLRAGQSRSARITLRSSGGMVQGRVASAPGWVRVEPAAFATRHRQPLTLTANANGVWPAGGAPLAEPIACNDVLILETDGGARQEVSLSATVLPARRGLAQVALWYVPLLLCCVLPALAGLSAPHAAGHVHIRHLWEPGLLAGALLSASLFALAWAADTVLVLRLLPLALLAILGGGFFGSISNIEMSHASKAALVQTSVPVLVMLILQTVTLAANPRGWGRWQWWRWIAGATGLLASWVLWHSG